MGSAKQMNEEELEKQLQFVPVTGMFAHKQGLRGHHTMARGQGNECYRLKHSRLAE